MAFEEASEKGLAVVALGTKMIDAPVVARARKTIILAEKLGLLILIGEMSVNILPTFPSRSSGSFWLLPLGGRLGMGVLSPLNL